MASRGDKPKRGKRPAIEAQEIQHQLEAAKARLQGMMEDVDPDDVTAGDVQNAKDFAAQMQEINRGLRESLKRAMMADGKIKPGEVLTIEGRRVFLTPRPGCPEGSLDPEHYDLTYEYVS
jgi:hypothetical protein